MRAILDGTAVRTVGQIEANRLEAQCLTDRTRDVAETCLVKFPSHVLDMRLAVDAEISVRVLNGDLRRVGADVDLEGARRGSRSRRTAVTGVVPKELRPIRYAIRHDAADAYRLKR